MAEWGRIGDLEVFSQQVAAACRRREALEGRAKGEAGAAQTLTELGIALEELRVAVEELRQQNLELTAARQDLVAEYQRYQELFDGIPDGYLVTDPNGLIRKGNRQAASLLGLPPEFLVGKPLVAFLAPEDRYDFFANLSRSVRASQGQEWAVTVVPKGRAPFPASLTVMRFSREGGGSSPDLRWLLRDLIQREEGAREDRGPATPGEERSQGQAAEIAENRWTEVAAPAVRIQPLEALLAAASEVSRELDLARLLELISLVVAGILGVGPGTVYLWDQGAELLIPHAWPGFGAWRSAMRLRLGEDVAGAAAERRAGLLVDDYRTSAHALPAFLGHSDATAVLAEPLLYRDRLLGVLTADNAGTGRAFTERDRETLALFAPQAAIVIENARLFEEVRRERAHLREMAVHAVEAEGGERLRLAADLHDLAVQNLAVLSLNLGLALGQLPADLQGMTRFWLQESLVLVGRMSDRVRTLMESLQPAAPDDLGLMAALRSWADRMGDWANLRVVAQGEEPAPRLSALAETALFSIAREALNNVVKHAQARNVTLKLATTPERVSLCITDDGVGFDPTQLDTSSERRNWGLFIMEERALSAGGHCRVEAAPGRGTRVIVEVPRGPDSAGEEALVPPPVVS